MIHLAVCDDDPAARLLLSNYIDRFFQERGEPFRLALFESSEDFLAHYRMARAADFLTTSDRQISDIAVMVGYPNALHFSRAFKQIYGMSPREYRQIHRIIS